MRNDFAHGQTARSPKASRAWQRGFSGAASLLFACIVFALAFAALAIAPDSVAMASQAGANSGEISISCPSKVHPSDKLTIRITAKRDLISEYDIFIYLPDTDLLSYDSYTRLDPGMEYYMGESYIALRNSDVGNRCDSVAVATVSFKVKAPASSEVKIVVAYSTEVEYSIMTATTGMQTLTVKVVEDYSAENRLASLSVAGYTLKPAFSPETLSYSLDVAYATKKLDIRYKAKDDKSKVAVKGNSLKENATTSVVVQVTAENGDVKKYTIAVFRARDPNYVESSNNALASLKPSIGTLVPPFDPSVQSYSLTLPFDTDRVEFAAGVADSRSTWSVPNQLRLEPGADTFASIPVKAENGQVRVYSVAVHREKDPRNPLGEGDIDRLVASLPVSSGHLGLTSTMVLPARLLDAASNEPEVQISAANALGSVSFAGSDVACILHAYYDMTVAQGSPHAIASLPQDAQVFSTRFEGQLFGQVSFSLNAAGTGNLSVYYYNPATGTCTPIAGAQGEGNIVTFAFDRGGTFVLTATGIAGAMPPVDVPAKTGGSLLDAALKWLEPEFLAVPAGLVGLFCIGCLLGSALPASVARDPGEDKGQSKGNDKGNSKGKSQSKQRI